MTDWSHFPRTRSNPGEELPVGELPMTRQRGISGDSVKTKGDGSFNGDDDDDDDDELMIS